LSESAPAGWYQDGQTAGHERYWDGAQWTDRFRPLHGEPSAPGPLARYWRATIALLRGDAAGAGEAAGRSALAAWIIPLALASIVFAFLLLGLLGWALGLPGAILRQYLGSISPYRADAPGMGGSDAVIASMFDPGAAGGVLAGAFFVGLGLAAACFALRALGVVLAARLRGTRVGYREALAVVGTAHLLTPYPLALAALFWLIPGTYGLVAAVIAVVGGIAAIVVAETAIAVRTREPGTGTGGAVIGGAVFGGASLIVVGVLAYWFVSLLAAAGYQASLGGLMLGMVGLRG